MKPTGAGRKARASSKRGLLGATEITGATAVELSRAFDGLSQAGGLRPG